MKEIPPYLEMRSATIKGPAANPSLIGTGKLGITIGMEPKIIPKSRPPKRERKSGSNNFFSEFPMIFSASSIASRDPITLKISQ